MFIRMIAAAWFTLLAPLSMSAEEVLPYRGQIALSFDDAPRNNGPHFTGSARTEALINALDAANAPPVVFFVKTKGLETIDGRTRITDYANAGHLIANHSHTHPWASRAGLEAVVAEIDHAETALENYPNRRSWFRFPYLDEGNTLTLRDSIRDALAERGLFNGYVTVDNYDWHLERQWHRAVRAGRTVDMDALKSTYIDMLLGAVSFYDRAAMDAFGKTAPHVLLLHENDLAALFIDDLIVALRSEGWEVISPDEAYAHPVASIQPETLRTRSGHFSALAIEAGRAPETLDNPAINEDAIDALLEERQVFGAAP